MAERQGLGFVPEVPYGGGAAHMGDPLHVQRQAPQDRARILHPDPVVGVDGVGLRAAVGAGIGVDIGLLGRPHGEGQAPVDRRKGGVQARTGGDIERHSDISFGCAGARPVRKLGRERAGRQGQSLAGRSIFAGAAVSRAKRP